MLASHIVGPGILSLWLLFSMHGAAARTEDGNMRVQDTATTCRERCGGQGYLSVNRFGAILGFAHAGMTAEGDNRVLMQKVKHFYRHTFPSSLEIAE